MLQAVVFDFDGIIVDTEPVHYQAFQAILQPYDLGYSWQEYLDRYIGYDDRDAFREVFCSAGKTLGDQQLAEMIVKKAKVFEEIIKHGVTPYPGVVPLIGAISGSLPLALCSGALSRDITPILKCLEISHAFDAIVTADDVPASKPDPASYVLTLQRLAAAFPDRQFKPEACLAIEDTPAGIASARGAGLQVLAVTNSYGAERLSGATKVIESLALETQTSLSAIIAELA
jgi:beta-phosphoglucomutase